MSLAQPAQKRHSVVFKGIIFLLLNQNKSGIAKLAPFPPPKAVAPTPEQDSSRQEGEGVHNPNRGSIFLPRGPRPGKRRSHTVACCWRILLRAILADVLVHLLVRGIFFLLAEREETC